VTFLLADVEGSTALWEEAPEAMRVALARHDVLFEAAIARHGGIHIRPRGEGDSRFAVFSSAPEATAAAVAIQRAFVAEAWPTPRPIRVRIGIHSGQAELRDGDYYGSAVNRCARLRAIGHGEQVLLSEAAAVLARDGLPHDLALLDLGEHRLKDLARAERVFLVRWSGDRTDEPSLRTLDSYPNNLPVQRSPLVGRERELQILQRMLLRPDVGLVTLTGPGGAGKTRLALQAAAEIVDHFRDGVFLVDLAPIREPGLVPTAVAQALGLQDVGARPVRASVLAYLRDKSLLIVLDNFEQVMPASTVVRDLLGACVGIKILVTTREPLRIRDEHEVPVPPLSLPNAGVVVSADTAAQYGALDLFRERATAMRPDFAITEENVQSLAEICARLDGLPLAIELAAARIRLLPPQALLARLGRRLPLLAGGARDLPARQQALRATIAWSYDLLDVDEQILFRRLAIFAGGCSLEAIDAVCGDENLQVDLLGLLESLVAKSLLRHGDALGGEPQFGMLETIREYAMERLDESGELVALRDRHLHYFAAFAEEAHGLRRGPFQAEALDRIERASDDVRAALAWSCAAGGGVHGDIVAPRRLEDGVRLAGALIFYWVVRGGARENRSRVMELVALAPPGTTIRALALNAAAQVCGRMLGDYEVATSLLDESLGFWSSTGQTQGLAVALERRGQVALETGDYDLAEELLSRAARLFRDDEDGSPLDGCNTPVEMYLAQVAQARGDGPRARRIYEQALAEAQERGDGHAISYAQRGLARLLRADGEEPRARALLLESLALLEPLKDIRCAQMSLSDLGSLLSASAPPTDVARLMGASEGLREMIGSPNSEAQRARHDRDVTTVRGRMNPADFDAARAEGRAMTLVRAIELALRVADEAPDAGLPMASAPSGPAEILTAREREVAALIARGFTNPQIASVLVISERTVHRHVSNMLEKLDLRSRAQVAAWVSRQRPTDPPIAT
jgi:predicted ATPase/class 3 adenylate cyclase/DNA-binding CsgD family transcriptional regulator